MALRADWLLMKTTPMVATFACYMRMSRGMMRNFVHVMGSGVPVILVPVIHT